MIDKSHYKKLKEILKSNGIQARDYEENKPLYLFLLRNHYIRKSEIDGYNGFVVDEDGKVEMRIYREDNRRFWITTFISSSALITSIIAILLQIEPLMQLISRLLK